MSCVDSMPPALAESEREEGEIVDELDDLSDISSEEEYLMRQRLQVLENYNHVLERKQAKRSSSVRPGKRKVNDVHPPGGDVSDISTTNLDDIILSPRIPKDVRHSKPIYHKHKRKKESLVRKSSLEQPLSRYKEHRRRPHKLKKKIGLKPQNASSDESDYEYRNKRRKLANAVSVKQGKTDSTLKARLMKMLCQTQNIGNPMIADSIEKEMKLAPDAHEWNLCSYAELPEVKDNKNTVNVDENNQEIVAELTTDTVDTKHEPNKEDTLDKKTNIIQEAEIIDSSSDGLELVADKNEPYVTENNELSIISIASSKTEEASDEDLESLRQHALKSKVSKSQDQISKKDDVSEPLDKQATESFSKPVLQSEDEDSDTAELRLICLRSALLKKAIEMKQKQKLRKRLSQSTSLYEDIISNDLDICPKSDVDNNTDIESVDMDIGSDAGELDDKGNMSNKSDEPTNGTDICEKATPREEKLNIPKNKEPKVDDLDLDDDEDLLRAKLLTSLSKSLPLKTLLINPDRIHSDDVQSNEKQKNNLEKSKIDVSNIPQEKRFIINTGGSDSEGEHEATKNLTKMHMKLSEQADFQHKLDMFLKSARREVEKNELPDVVQQPQLIVSLPKTPDKFVPKAVNHLPKSEQIEYKNLVKRMTELEKMKQSRQLSMNTLSNKSRKVTIDDEMKNSVLFNLDEQISMSRKKIAEESAKVLQLKEEGAKLSQKYKIVATELRNLSTAISLNKKNQHTSQAKLARTRSQHQLLLKRSNMTVRNTQPLRSVNTTHKKVTLSSNIQKENEPLIDEIDPLKAVKVSVVNDYKPDTEMNEHTLSIQIDVASNKQTVTMPKKSNQVKEFACTGHRIVKEKDDYESPLQALSSEGWDEDPNGVLCPFEVAGSCKDTNCKYLHPKPTH